jgi:hypothetical protein
MWPTMTDGRLTGLANFTGFTVHINQGVKQGCPMSPTLFNIFIDEVIRQWQDVLIKYFKVGNTVLNNFICGQSGYFLVNQRPAIKEQLIDLKI